MRDLVNNLLIKRGLSPVVGTDNTALVSQIIDTQGLSALMFAILTGTLADADATFVTLVEHGDAANLSDAAAAPDEQLLGTEVLASFAFGDDDKVFKIGYRVGAKRYVRITVTPANNTGNAPIAILAIASPLSLPTANPPA